jgi:miniconductance mechanosensitive channel
LEFLTTIKQNIYLQAGLVCIGSYIFFLASKIIILKPINSWFRKTKTKLDDIFLQSGFFNRLIYLIPLLILYNLEGIFSQYSIIIHRILNSIFVLIIFICINVLLSAFGDIYDRSRFSRRIHIKGYLQVVKLILFIVGILGIITILTGQSPVYLLSGIGALTAVLMLVFKDTILSFVATIQINSNDLFKIGDWVDAPQFGADGDVVDIALHTVKIQNWDKTITTIPTHKLIDSSFKNWRGMTDSGGRRIKRAIYIDISTIRFWDKELLRRFQQLDLLQDYLESKLKEVDNSNQTVGANLDQMIKGRRFTNIGTFRAYIKAFLKNHSDIHDEMTFLIRQLPPGEKGLPMEIYVFTNDTDWVRYESIQSDIFDHLMAIVSEFDLKVFQNPSGNDFKSIAQSK